MTKGDKTLVAVITGDNRVSFHSATVFISDVKTVRFGKGLKEGETVVLNPGFGIREEQKVQPVQAIR